MAMALALLAAWLLARLFPVGYAPASVAEWIMARTPPDLANALLARLGGFARPTALLGGFAAYLGFGLAAGLADRLLAGRPRAVLLIAVALAALWCLLARLAGLPLAENALLLALFLPAWLRLRDLARPDPAPIPAAPSRRTFLRGAALSGGVVLSAAAVVALDAYLRASRAVALGGAFLFGWSPPAARAAGFDLEGLTPEATPVGRFYRMSKNLRDPRIRAEDWSLTVAGLVGSELRLGYDELLALPRRDLYVTLRCVSNRIDGELMGAALFSGVPLRLLLERAGVDPRAGRAVFRAPDGHTDSLDLAQALADDTLIAYAMNGRTLTAAHGFPARLLIPGRYGFKHVKWLDRIELIAGGYRGTWQALGWTEAALVKTVARIDLARPDGDRVLVAGVAYAGDRGIRAVQVRAGDGPWTEATLHAPPLSPLTWVQWRADLPAGARAVTARAVDGDGNPQEERAQGQFPDGAQGWHSVRVAG